MKHDQDFDVIVIGGGHAGTEAAAGAARVGARTALLTLHTAQIGVMSCNPAIGGIGKGHLVREIDALDGIMGRAADASGIQFRMLNRRKGPAVRGPRTQADRSLYKFAVQEALRGTDNLTILEGEAVAINDLAGRKVVRLNDGMEFVCSAVVLTTGTFLGGVIHQGDKQWPAGRMGDKAANALSVWLRSICKVGRLKTGTPPRLRRDSIDWQALESQHADDEPEPFSFLTERIQVPQIACGITRTTNKTHDIIRANLHRSAMYSGAISGVGPRYCPSIEDKIARFGDRDGHQIFLEPEGLDDPLVYPNGISTSLPKDVQLNLVRSLPGLEKSEVEQFGYAIEYDYVDPRSLSSCLEMRAAPGLFLAGQINGTTGYEEAAAQGIVAGLNAARRAQRLPDVTFSRATSYIGVMIDDLISQGVSEPYRMFTSRSEFRLSLRPDNADERLTPFGMEVGLVKRHRGEHFRRSQDALEAARALSKSLTASPTVLRGHGLNTNLDGRRRSAFELLADEQTSELARIWPALLGIDQKIAGRLEIDAKYAVYLDRQHIDASNLKAEEAASIEGVLFDALPGLSAELRGKLSKRLPKSLGELKRVEGITPAAIALVLSHAREQSRGRV